MKAVYKACWIVLILTNVGFSQTNDSSKIDDSLVEFVVSASVFKGEYSIERFCSFAQSLRELDDSKRVEQLEAFCKRCDIEGNNVNGVIICQMLFKPHRPLLGGPVWIGMPKNQIRVAEPIVFVNSIPILSVRGYMLGGIPQTSHEFMQQCLSTRIWVEKIEGLDEMKIRGSLKWYMEFLEIAKEKNDVRLLEQREFFLSQVDGQSKVKTKVSTERSNNR